MKPKSFAYYAFVHSIIGNGVLSSMFLFMAFYFTFIFQTKLNFLYIILLWAFTFFQSLYTLSISIKGPLLEATPSELIYMKRFHKESIPWKEIKSVRFIRDYRKKDYDINTYERNAYGLENVLLVETTYGYTHILISNTNV